MNEERKSNTVVIESSLIGETKSSYKHKCFERFINPLIGQRFKSKLSDAKPPNYNPWNIQNVFILRVSRRISKENQICRGLFASSVMHFRSRLLLLSLFTIKNEKNKKIIQNM